MLIIFNVFSIVQKNVETTINNMALEKTELVVDAYEHAMLGRFPRARYVIGGHAKFLFMPIQVNIIVLE